MNNLESPHANSGGRNPELPLNDSETLLLLQKNIIEDWLKEEHKERDAGMEWIGRYARHAREIFDSEGDHFVDLIRDGQAEEAKKEIQKRLYH